MKLEYATFLLNTAKNTFAKVAEYGNFVAVTYGNGCTVLECSRICALPELGVRRYFLYL